MDLSKAMVKRLGYNSDYIRYDWQTAVKMAQIYQANPKGDCTTNVYPNGYRCIDDTYYDGYTLRRDYLGYVRLDSRIADNLTIRVQPYIHRNLAEGTYWYPYAGTPGGAPLFVRVSGSRTKREGVNRDDPGVPLEPLVIRSGASAVQRFTRTPQQLERCGSLEEISGTL